MVFNICLSPTSRAAKHMKVTKYPCPEFAEPLDKTGALPLTWLALSGRLSYRVLLNQPLCLLGFWWWDRGARPPLQFLFENSLSHVTSPGYHGKCHVLHLITCCDVLGSFEKDIPSKNQAVFPSTELCIEEKSQGKEHGMFCIFPHSWISWNECRRDPAGAELICGCPCQKVKVTREGARVAHGLHDLLRIKSCENRNDAQKVCTWLNWCGC